MYLCIYLSPKGRPFISDAKTTKIHKAQVPGSSSDGSKNNESELLLAEQVQLKLGLCYVFFLTVIFLG